MNTDTTAYTMAQVGLRQIEEAILRLLTINPQGLRISRLQNRWDYALIFSAVTGTI